MIVLPVASLIFPNLLQLVRSLPPNSSEQWTAITVLFAANRIYLYVMATTLVGLAALRGSTDAPQLGRRITDLTEELLYRPTLSQKKKDNNPSSTTTSQPLSEKPRMIQSLADSGLERSLDQVTSETQALILPLLVSFLLALSIFFLPFWSGTPSLMIDNNGQNSLQTVQEFLSTILPTISRTWNVGLLAIFTRSEVRRLAFELKWNVPDSAAFEWVTAVAITSLACFVQMWPAQNFVNMALAILVSRAIQLDSFVAIVGALSLLTLYDVTSVFLIPAAGASDMVLLEVEPHHAEVLVSSSFDVAFESSAGRSAMGSVAMQKLTSETFTPGLLTTKIGNSLGGALGLGDAVFPSLMASFAKRFDDSHDAVTDPGDRISIFAVCMLGYVLGCAACEFAPLISTSGLPALVFIIPCMLCSILIGGAVSGQLQELIAYNPKDEAT